MCQIHAVADFQTSFVGTLGSKLAIKKLLKILSHFKALLNYLLNIVDIIKPVRHMLRGTVNW